MVLTIIETLIDKLATLLQKKREFRYTLIVQYLILNPKGNVSDFLILSEINNSYDKEAFFATLKPQHYTHKAEEQFNNTSDGNHSDDDDANSDDTIPSSNTKEDSDALLQ